MYIVFYDIFKDLCNKKDVSPSWACLDMGLSRSLGAKWKNTGANPSYEVLTKMAGYFDVPVDYLLGNEQKEKPAQAVQVRDEHDNIVVLDDEARDLIDSLRKNPEMKMLFSVSKGATKISIHAPV